jgi:cellobiose phosphorylase
MYQAGIEWIIGLRKVGDRLYFRPAVPHDWPGYEVEYRYRTTLYQVKVRMLDDASVQSLPLDIDATGNLSVHRPSHEARRDESGMYIQLIDDGGTHTIELQLPRRPATASHDAVTI